MIKKQQILMPWLIGALLIVGGVAYATFQPTEFLSGTALLSLNPENTTAGPSESVFVSLRIEYAENIYGVDIPITYNSSIIHVVDSNGSTPGIQITPGDCPKPDSVIENEANNTNGKINYAAFSIAPTIGCDGGDVAHIEFRCIGLGTSAIVIEPEVLIANSNNPEPLAFTTINASITCASITSTPGPSPTATLKPPTPTPTPTPTATPAIYLPLIIKQSSN